MKLKIVADAALHGLEVLEEHDVIRLPGREISAEHLQGANALLVRSITKVDQHLIGQTDELTYVGTATIGTDHIDVDELRQRDIGFSSAPGCNANAVVDYVLSTLFSCFPSDSQYELSELCIGIAGYGNVGKRLAKALSGLGISTKVFDPLLDQALIPNACNQEELLACDTISLHVPMSVDGPYSTLGWFSEKVFARLQHLKCLINTSRGDVIDQSALLDFIKNRSNKNFAAVLDVWPNEPAINVELLERCRIATPHIAGYSMAGKLRGSLTIFEGLQRHFNIELANNRWLEFEQSIQHVTQPAGWASGQAQGQDKLLIENARESLAKIIDLEALSEEFKSMLVAEPSSEKRSKLFDDYRKSYQPRQEFLYLP